MSEQNSLKQLYANAKNTFDLDLFLYTGLPIVGRDGLIQIVADVIFDRLVQTCKNQKELALEMLEPSVLFAKIKAMKVEFIKSISGCQNWTTRGIKVQHIGLVYANYFYTADWQFHMDLPDGGYQVSGAFIRRICEFDSVDFSKFQLYKIAYSQTNTFIFSYLESPELLQHTLDFINSN